ncbi:FAD-dependent oxidoreductase [Streptomyces sp. P9-A2]|uniref:FAD-dependent oxidoreductase n=1 Tax=Streptomyces sp. P9-A2 TaxID=3072284 RepID=UPI002FC6EFCA
MAGGGPRIAIVGGGIAGTLLAWRTVRARGAASVDLFTGGAAGGEGPVGTEGGGGAGSAGNAVGRTDASRVSGGLVRGFEPTAAAAGPAAESLAEIRGSDRLREWSGYRETGSLYVLSGDADVRAPVDVVDVRLPGSAEVVGRDGILRAFPFRELPPGSVAVVERYAGYISPHRLRGAALRAAAGAGATVHAAAVDAVTPDPTVRTADGRTLRYDRVVVATGAWTPGLLARGGLPDAGLRTKHIQYSLCRASPDGVSPGGAVLGGLVPFVDENSGLYGRPWGDGTFLLGIPCDRWDVDPDAVTPDTETAERLAERVRQVFGVTVTVVRTVASCDCYHDPGGLELRSLGPGLYTFTGGSGGAAKTVVFASRKAAAALLE